MPLKDSGLMSLGPHQHERQWWPRAVHEQGLELPQARSQEISPDLPPGLRASLNGGNSLAWF